MGTGAMQREQGIKHRIAMSIFVCLFVCLDKNSWPLFPCIRMFLMASCCSHKFFVTSLDLVSFRADFELNPELEPIWCLYSSSHPLPAYMLLVFYISGQIHPEKPWRMCQMRISMVIADFVFFCVSLLTKFVVIFWMHRIHLFPWELGLYLVE